MPLLYPYYYSKMTYDGFKSIGRDDIITLTRCAYLGSQKFAPIVNRGQTVKTVYIPDGEWVLTKDKKVYTKGTYEITANIDEFIAFVKAGSSVIECFE